jgi:nitrite reductase (NADH) large subunit
MHIDREVVCESERGIGLGLRIVVVGNGMVGHRFCETLAERDSAAAVRIVVFGKEPRVAYDRVHLSGYFDGQSTEDPSFDSKQWYADNQIELHLGDPVVEIDRENRRTIWAAHHRPIVFLLRGARAPRRRAVY